jgi:hypothetical protein
MAAAAQYGVAKPDESQTLEGKQQTSETHKILKKKALS